MKFRLLGLHPTVVVLATHFIVDGFGNILAPLLPLLILNLNLSLAAAGTLQMCFQLANSVAQLGFGHIADRWRPRLLLMAGPVLMRDDNHADRTRAEIPSRWRSCSCLAVSAARRSIRRPPRWCTDSLERSAAWPCLLTSRAAQSARPWRRWSSRRSSSSSGSKRRPC